MPDLKKVTAAEYLEARDIVANAIKPYTSVQANTRREIAEGLMSKGWLDVHQILDDHYGVVVEP